MPMSKWGEKRVEQLATFTARIPKSLYDAVDDLATGESMRQILIKALHLWVAWKSKEIENGTPTT